MSKDAITKFEQELNIVALDEKRVAKFKTKEELHADYMDNYYAYRGVTYTDRLEFLKANKYELTRENFLNPDLPNRITPDEKRKKK